MVRKIFVMVVNLALTGPVRRRMLFQKTKGTYDLCGGKHSHFIRFQKGQVYLVISTTW